MGKVERGERRGGRVLMLDGLGEGASVRRLTPLDFAVQGVGRHDEAWLQSLVQRHPQVLPVTDIEPGFDDLVPVCMELPLPSGYLDNLLVTARGDLVLVECKLWRNPQARREVVAQIIDYAHCLARWDYAALDAAVTKARAREGGDGAGLYAVAAAASEAIAEDAFADAVSRNLRLGRFLLLVVGDGIHEGVETLAEYLDQHAGFHFTMGLVELRVHAVPDEGYVVVPQVIARTLNVERAVVRVEEGRAVVGAVEDAGSGGSGRPTTISEERLFEALSGIGADLPEGLRGFAARLEDAGVRIEATARSLVLRWRDGMGGELNIGAVTERGEYISEYANWAPDKIGRLDLAHAYQERIAALVGGSVRRTPVGYSWYVVTDGTIKPMLSDMLERAKGWEAAIRDFVEAYRRALAEEG